MSEQLRKALVDLILAVGNGQQSEILAAVDRASKVLGPSPMSTAPRDGTRIIVTKKPNLSYPFRKHNRFYAKWQPRAWGGFWNLVSMEGSYATESVVSDDKLEGWEPCP